MADETTTATATQGGNPVPVTVTILPPAPAEPGTKPGYKTTEFWKSTLVSVFGLIMASGAIPSTGYWGQLAGLIASVLVTLGYTQARASTKAAG